MIVASRQRAILASRRRLRNDQAQAYFDRARGDQIMGEVINLRQARKAKQRRDAASAADEARAAHGRTKRERDAVKSAKEKAERDLDGHKREED